MDIAKTGNESVIWDALMAAGLTKAGAAGLMGNLYAESGLEPGNLQNSFNSRLGLTDAEYTAAVDNGTYTGFATDSAGYGLAQWTYRERKKKLLDFAKEKGSSIGNLDMQIEFLLKELADDYAGVLGILRNTNSIVTASNAVLTKYERPADQGEKVKSRRESYAKAYYDMFA